MMFEIFQRWFWSRTTSLLCRWHMPNSRHLQLCVRIAWKPTSTHWKHYFSEWTWFSYRIFIWKYCILLKILIFWTLSSMYLIMWTKFLIAIKMNGMQHAAIYCLNIIIGIEAPFILYPNIYYQRWYSYLV